MELEGARCIVLFDGVCNLCDGFVNFVYQRDVNKKFFFCPLQSATGQRLLVKYDLPTNLSTIIYIEESQGQVFTHSSAVLQILSYLASPYPALYYFVFIPPIIRDTVYKLIAANRYRLFGISDGTEACGFNPGLRSRFIDYAHVEVTTEMAQEV